MKHDPQAPPRLVDTPGPAGDCVRRALAASSRPSELPPFNALRERRQRRAQRQLVLGALLATSTLAVGLRFARHEEEAPSVRAEATSAPWRGRETAVEASARAEPPPAVPAPALVERPVPGVARRQPRPSSARVEPARPLEAVPPVEVAAPRDVAAPRGARACAELARSGAAERARSCYEELASGTGITAELALFEQARLEGKALRRPELAVETLENHRRRFPNGSLRAEVMLAQIEWLLRAGERARALALIDEALTSGSLRERQPELERLRDTLGAPTAPTAP